MKIDLVLALLAFVGGAILWVASTDASVGNGEVAQYCEMREIYEQSGGEYGWPPHDEAKEEECK